MRGNSIGFERQGFGNEETTGVSSVKRYQKLLLCLLEPVPASSNRDLTLAKAEPTNGSGSKTTNLRRKYCCETEDVRGGVGI